MGLCETKIFGILQERKIALDDPKALGVCEEVIRGILTAKWALGFRDRGLGHGDYGVIIEASGELLLPDVTRDVAQHIIDLHNASLVHENEQVAPTEVQASAPEAAQSGRRTNARRKKPKDK